MITQKNSAKAIILINEHVLLIKKVYEDGREVYTLPGGTQEPHETLAEALIREVKEEIDASVEVLDLVHVYEHARQSTKTPNLTKHKIEFAFVCRLTEPYQPHNGAKPDSNQAEVEWVSLESLSDIALNPAEIATIIPQLSLTSHRIYLGKVT